MRTARPNHVLLGLGLLPALWLWGQAPPASAPATPAAPPNPFLLSPEERARLEQRAAEDHADMMKQLGITKLRPGRSGFPKAGDPNAANYDPAKANPYPDWPDVLTLKDGGKVTTAEMWWRQRRPEIVEDFEREVYGRVPADVPKVAWTVAETVETTVGGQPVVARRVVGHVDNSAHPAIAVDIRMAVVLPVNAKGPVPVLMMFGWGNMPGDPLPRFPGMPRSPPPRPRRTSSSPPGGATSHSSTASIQADNGAGLTEGVIGLTNKGKRRTPEQWGALRAWAWGAARALDYLETLPAVDARRVGIEGVSRYGKAALVTMAFESRFALVLVGSSGEGGAKPHRRDFGEAVENLTGSGAYHWMAGNFLKYGAAEATFGSRNASDIPVDAHELIALCAPRPTFISYGIPEKGDANWLDQQGSYMATVAAGPVFRLLGARDLGVTEDYRVAKMPPVNTGLARRRAGLAPARRRARGPVEHELLHRLGEPAAPVHAAPGARGPAADARRPELPPRPPAAPGQGEERRHRRLLPRRLDHAPLGRDRLPGLPGPLEEDLPRLECRELRLGRRTGRRTSSGASRTARSTASTRRSS